MPEQAVMPFNSEGFCLGLRMPSLGDKRLVGLPVIRHHPPNRHVRYGLPELFPRGSSPGAQYAVEEPFPMSINSNPYPAIVFFEPT